MYIQTHRRAIAKSEIVKRGVFSAIYLYELFAAALYIIGWHTHSLCDDLFGFYGIVAALIIRLEQHT